MSALVSPDLLRRWSVTAIGVLLCATIVAAIVVTRIEWTTVHHLQFAVPILLSLGLTVYGGWLAGSGLPAERITRIAVWSLSGTVVIGSFATWEMFLHLAEVAFFRERRRSAVPIEETRSRCPKRSHAPLPLRYYGDGTRRRGSGSA